MGIQSQAGQLGFKKQSAEGTFATPDKFMLYRGGSIAANRDLLIPDPEIGGGRDINAAYNGPVSYSGEFEFYARMEMLATLLGGAFGKVTSTAVGTGPTQVGTHVITPDDTSPWFSFEERVGTGVGSETFRYTDAKINSISLECEPDGYLQGTVGVLARKQTSGHAATVPAAGQLDVTPLLVGTNMTCTIGGLTTYITRSFQFDYNNNIEDDVFQLGSLYLADMTEKRREVTMGFTIRPTDLNLWKEATYGSSGASEAQAGAAVRKAMKVNIESYEFITGTTVFSLEIDVPQAVMQPFAIEPSGDDVIEYDIEVQAIRPSTATPICTATVVNALATA